MMEVTCDLVPLYYLAIMNLWTRLVYFVFQGTLVASVDSRGIVKLWDTRKVTEFLTIDTGPNAANKCAFDKSGNVIAIASSDNVIKWWGTTAFISEAEYNT